MMGSTSYGHATTRLGATRKRLVTGVAAAVGLTLLAPALAVAPAHADLGILDPVTGTVVTLVPPTPVIAPGGAGQIEFLGAVVCSSDGTVQKTCEELPLSGIDGAVSLVLTAVAAESGDVPTWGAGCPEVLANVCTIPVEDLVGSTPLAPVVTFLPGGAAAAPDTKITSAAPARSRTEHTFTFEADPKTETTAFECKLQVTYKGTPPTGAQQAHDWRLCESGMTYRDLADGDYVFAVKAVEGTGDGAVEDDTPATQSWTVATPPEVPETRIVAGPRSGSWVLKNSVTYRFTSSVEGSQFQCEVGSRTYPCDSGSFTLRGLEKGSHRFEVFAMANKTRDFTPARRTFHVPLDDRALKPVGSWAGKKAKGHFKNTFRQSTQKGAALVTRSPQKFRRIALVADKGRGHGTVRVYWNKRLLAEVSLQAKRDLKRRVIPVKRFTGKMRKGTLRVVVVSAGKVVRVDGLGIADR